MEVYERFATDPNKERAVDNFLVANGLKEKSAIKSEQRVVSVKVCPSAAENPKGTLTFSKPKAGYAEARLSVLTGGEWLSLDKDRLLSADFGADDRAHIGFEVRAEEFARGGKRVDFAFIDVDSEGGKVGGVYVMAAAERPFSAELNKTRYGMDDEGFIKIRNRTNRDMMVEIFSKEGFAKFGGRKYYISAYAEIPFTIKFTGFQMAQAAFRKQPTYESQIVIAADRERQILNLVVLG
jgi:hypothetical protein